MGLGKTAITLTAIDRLMYDSLEVAKVLVIAPKSVAESTWDNELRKWKHLKHLKISKVLGTPKERRKALAKEADIYIVNRENVEWLVNELSCFGEGWSFDMVVIDELSSFKASKAKRFKALKKYITKSKRVLGLTGTPAPNGLMDLWSQIYLLDGGERLGTTITYYRDRYFTPGKRNQSVIFNYEPKKEAEKNIYNAIEDICLSMKAEDLLELPTRIDNIVSIDFNEKELTAYKSFEKESYLAIKESEITAQTAAVLTNKLLQYCNGSVYDENRDYVNIHSKKLQALEEIVECSQGKPILCFYNYKFDLETIRKKFKNAVFIKDGDIQEIIERWNKGEIPLLLAHPASAGHGLNLQAGGSIIVWYGLTWSLELYQQANARLHRQGQKEKVIIHHLIINGTVENRVYKSLQQKSDLQEELINYLKAEYGE